MDSLGLCDVIRHLDICFGSKTSKNSIHRSSQRDARRQVHLITENNPAKRNRDIINDAMLKLPELRAENGHLVAGASALRGIKRRAERQSAKYVKKQCIGPIDINEIPVNLLSMEVDYPGYGFELMSFSVNGIGQFKISHSKSHFS